jgi:hypothetical protein
VRVWNRCYILFCKRTRGHTLTHTHTQRHRQRERERERKAHTDGCHDLRGVVAASVAKR